MHCWFAAVPANCSHKRISRIKIPVKLTVKYIRLNSQLICQCHWLWLCFALLLSLEIDVVYSSYNTISLIMFQVFKKTSIKMLAQVRSLHMFNTCYFVFRLGREKNISLCFALVYMFVLLVWVVLLWNFTEIQWKCAMSSSHAIWSIDSNHQHNNIMNKWTSGKFTGNITKQLPWNEKRKFDAHHIQFGSAIKISPYTRLVIYHQA